MAEVVELNGSQIDSPPNVGNEENSRYIQGVATRENELLIVIDLNKLLTEKDWDEVEKTLNQDEGTDPNGRD